MCQTCLSQRSKLYFTIASRDGSDSTRHLELHSSRGVEEITPDASFFTGTVEPEQLLLLLILSPREKLNSQNSDAKEFVF